MTAVDQHVRPTGDVGTAATPAVSSAPVPAGASASVTSASVTAASATPASVTVRLVESSEHAAVAELLVDAYGNDYDISPEYRQTLEAVAERAAVHEVWVAVDAGGQLLGTVATPRAGHVMSELALDGELDFRLLGVSPAARGRGVGETLTRHVVELGRARGASRVVMNSGPQMVSAHRLYHRLGFARSHDRETRVLDDGTRLFAFVLELAPPAAGGSLPGAPDAGRPLSDPSTAKA